MALIKWSILLFLLITSYSDCDEPGTDDPSPSLTCSFPDINIQKGFQSPYRQCGADRNPTGNPIGGGDGYRRLISKRQASFVVSTVKELAQAVADSKDGDIIFLDGDAQFDLAAYPGLLIDKRITLASDRGWQQGDGALVFSTFPIQGDDYYSLFKVEADLVRFTGLRLRGPHSDTGEAKRNAVGLNIRESSCIEVDNCEIYYWSNAGVFAHESDNVYVHHNNIHHCQGYGLGYGVVLSGKSEVLVEANGFDSNRHDIAASGVAGQQYAARYNRVYSNAPLSSAHSFDMHCVEESKYGCLPPHDIGGDIIQIYNNTLADAANPAVKVRGNPQTGCWIQNNYFPNSSVDEAVVKNSHVVNLFQKNNCVGFEARALYLSKSGNHPWEGHQIAAGSHPALGFGDFNGDGRTDILMAYGGQWRMASAGRSAWQPWNTSSYEISQMGFGDFNKDKKADVLITANGKWRVSLSGNSPWQDWNTSDYTLSQMGLGDFNGDGATDVLITANGKWRVSLSGNSPWQDWNTSDYTLSQMGFGDFNGDGATDVLITANGKWRVSLSGNSPWQDWNTSDYTLPQMGLGDFNGDGATDVLITTNGKWRVSLSGNSPWQDWNTSDYTLSQISFGDFNGDGATDVLRR